MQNSQRKEQQKWLRLNADDGWQIVLPDYDSKPHGFPKGKKKAELAGLDCPCKPKIDYLDKIIIHNSFIDQEKIDESLSNITLEK